MPFMDNCCRHIFSSAIYGHLFELQNEKYWSWWSK